MRTTVLLLLLSTPCAIAAQAPPNKLEADLAKAKADYDRDPSSAGAAIWLGRRLAYLVNGDRARAKSVFDRVLAGTATTAFGFIAAEADVKRGF
jgi:hypothetical protein